MSSRKDRTIQSKAAEVADRRLKILEYRKMRMPLRQIAEKLGISKSQVGRDLEVAMKQLDRATSKAASQHRLSELESLDFAAQCLVPKVLKGETAAIREWTRLSESRRKLMGWDAPQKIAATNVDGSDRLGRKFGPLSMAELELLNDILSKVEVDDASEEEADGD